MKKFKKVKLNASGGSKEKPRIRDVVLPATSRKGRSGLHAKLLPDHIDFMAMLVATRVGARHGDLVDALMLEFGDFMVNHDAKQRRAWWSRELRREFPRNRMGVLHESCRHTDIVNAHRVAWQQTIKERHRLANRDPRIAELERLYMLAAMPRLFRMDEVRFVREVKEKRKVYNAKLGIWEDKSFTKRFTDYKPVEIFQIDVDGARRCLEDIAREVGDRTATPTIDVPPEVRDFFKSVRDARRKLVAKDPTGIANPEPVASDNDGD